MDRDTLAGIIPLALGHDQEASACAWVRLTGRTAEYPSRKAEVALAVASGALPIAPDLVELLFRCDDCGRCGSASILPGPPDLARALWDVRALLVANSAAPEVAPLAKMQRRFGNLYGGVGEIVSRLTTGDSGADVLFVPGAATLFFTPDAAVAALNLIKGVQGGVDVRPDCLDSGQTLRELGLAGQADEVQDRLRQWVEDAGYRLVIAGTPKEAFGLREALEGLPVEVQYAGNVLARTSRECLAPPATERFDGVVVVHPSEMLLHRLHGFADIDDWLGSVLGDRYRREPDPRTNALPAAIERPVVGTPASLTRVLAEQRLAQLQAIAGVGGTSDRERLVVLTCDPFSWQALREIAPHSIDVVDLMVFVAGLAGEAKRI